MMQYSYSSKLTKVIDGDTVDLVIDVGFHTLRHERIRLYDVNTPEMYGIEKKTGIKYKEFVKDWFAKYGNECQIDTIKDTKGKYGRYLGIIYNPAECLNKILNEMLERETE